MKNQTLFTQETNFEKVINHAAAALWENREEGFATSRVDKTKLYWCKLTSAEHQKAVVVVNGRIESTWKYQELFYELFMQGYDVYSFDHRGQGLSERLIKDKEMGYVYDFNDYVEDMSHLLKTFDLAHYDKKYLLAHSMGSTISTRYMQTYTNHIFDAACLVAPMYGVPMPVWLKPIAIPLTQIITAFYPKTNYAPGYSRYQAKPFKGNLLSQSELRYRWFRDLYESKPELKVGGPSIRWVWQGLMAAKQCLQMARHIQIPVQIIQGKEDRIVSNKSQLAFFQRLQKENSKAEFIAVEGAKHELMFEKDSCRNQVLNSLLTFFTKH
ncbi:Lysophospholipase L2 [Vibrio marisflavi CECT 7928]|uniref:Lysophospholipase L2 n=2 Tax=Vibrio marisflavi TaxID=1216040 RepID=A0ABN8E8B3_9VIBR|nr:Lysophospholipase L2 [Vibrio marisflavi CECT 7928]